MENLTVSGVVKQGFDAVRAAFVENFERRNELGAACCVYYRGEKVVDLWGGVRNKATGEPWEEDTMVLFFSTTKGLAAMAVALAQSRGLQIRAAQGKGPAPAQQPSDPPPWAPSPRMMRVFAALPFFVRKALYWDRLLNDPFRMKRQMGTVAVTAVGMFAEIRSGSGWGIPIEFHPLTVAIGAIARKPAFVGERVASREFLGMTLMFDHDVIDGAPMAMFLQRFRELVESGYGL
jgi:hypothetical protein